MKLSGTTYRRLTAQEERELAMERPREPLPRCRASRAGARAASPAWRVWRESEARRTLIECNIPWAVRVARGIDCPRFGEDRYGVALLATCEAADRFDPDKGRMTTYLKFCVVQNVRRASMEGCYAARVPEDVQEYVRSLGRGAPARPRRPTMDEAVPFARVAMAPRWHDRGVRAGDSTHFWDRIPDPRAGRPGDSDPAPSDLAERLMAAIEKLPPDLSEVVRLVHFSGDDPPTQRQIAAAAGVSHQAISVRLRTAYARLRVALASPAEMTA